MHYHLGHSQTYEGALWIGSSIRADLALRLVTIFPTHTAGQERRKQNISTPKMAVSPILPALLLIFVFFDAQVHTHAQCVDAGLARAARTCSRRLSLGQRQCRLFPTPERSIVRSLPPGEFRLSQLRKGVFLYDDSFYTSLILRMGRRLALLDIPESISLDGPDGNRTAFASAAEQVLNGTIPKRIDIVYSHGHFDHIGGTTRFVAYMEERYPSASIFIWGTSTARVLIENSVTKRAIFPNVIVGRRGRTLSLGEGLDVRMQIVGGHTASDLALYIPRFRDEPSILMHVDVVFPNWAPPFNLAVTEDVGGYVRVHEELLKFDFDIFVSGHWSVGDRKSVETNHEYSKDLVQAAVTVFDEVTPEDYNEAGFGRFIDPRAREFGNALYSFVNVFREVQIEACYKIIIDKWGCRLPGLDLVGRGHCFTALTYVQIEY